MNNYTEENQKAEFIGGAIAGGCGLMIIAFVIMLAIIGILGAAFGD